MGVKLPVTKERGVRLSPCGTYRYALTRSWPFSARHAGYYVPQKPADASVLFVLLNPSTADARVDDPTVRRLVWFANRWGYAQLAVANLYAFRSKTPASLKTAADPVGPGCDRELRRLAEQADRVVVGWGANKAVKPDRVTAVVALLQAAGHDALHCLGANADGSPLHPLYVAADTPLTRWPVVAPLPPGPAAPVTPDPIVAAEADAVVAGPSTRVDQVAAAVNQAQTTEQAAAVAAFGRRFASAVDAPVVVPLTTS